MAKDTSVSIRMDSKLKEETERVLEQFGLNITVVVNMMFHQIVREQAIPLSLKLSPRTSALDELSMARNERLAGYLGRAADAVAADMERIVAEAEIDYGQ